MEKKYVLIPGRHHILSEFMHGYFSEIAKTKTARLVDGSKEKLSTDLTFVWAITSANHSNTRRNPFPSNRREAAIESFSGDIPARTLVYHIPDIGQSNRFAHFVTNTIEVESKGQVCLTPENCVVATSTPQVIDQFASEGFAQFAPIELKSIEPLTLVSERAWELIEKLVAEGANWRTNKDLNAKIHVSSKEMLEKYLLGDQLIEINSDPLGGSEGNITETRDYEVYRASFDQGADRKYELISDHIVPGRIVDIGCATGSIIKKMSFDENLRESDIFGIEVARPLYEMCLQAKHNGAFGNDNVYFYQRNIMQSKLFPDNSIQTTTSFSLTHEIESYLGRESLLKFISQIYDQTASGGSYINVDVIGPEDGDRDVFLWLNHEDGSDDDGRESDHSKHKEYTVFLNGLSTFGKFKRFVVDFRAEEHDQIKYKLFESGGKRYARLRLRDAADFIETKDYTDSWFSEMHERFCFWSLSDWKSQLEAVGFVVDPSSYTYRNEWIVENRFEGKVALYEANDMNEPQIKMDFPVTSIVIIAKKP